MKVEHDSIAEALDRVSNRLDAIDKRLCELENGKSCCHSDDADDYDESDNYDIDEEIIESYTKWKQLSDAEKDDINDVMCGFDFGNVKKTMDALEWTWCGSIDVPSIYTIKKSAFRMLVDTLIEHQTISTGGFETVYFKDEDEPHGYRLGLKFVASEYGAY